MKNLTKEEKEKIKLMAKLFNAKEIIIDGVRYNPPKQEKK
jgi:hypothetical protein